MKKNKEETVKSQYRLVKETKELIIVYVNYTKFKRWYEAYSLYDYMHFDADKDWLLEKTGWKIMDRKKWTNPVKKFGLRPLLRKFTNRYYIVYAEKIK